jgi:hypothetical protein
MPIVAPDHADVPPQELPMIPNLTATFDFHSQALSLRAERQRVIASNIANADTPGYQARDFDFASALRAATGSTGVGEGIASTVMSRTGRPTPELRYAQPSADQPGQQHRGHGPRTRGLHGKRLQVRIHPALHQRQRAHHARCHERATTQA